MSYTYSIAIKLVLSEFRSQLYFFLIAKKDRYYLKETFTDNDYHTLEWEKYNFQIKLIQMGRFIAGRELTWCLQFSMGTKYVKN